jgi:hypothetical protein
MGMDALQGPREGSFEFRSTLATSLDLQHPSPPAIAFITAGIIQCAGERRSRACTRTRTAPEQGQSRSEHPTVKKTAVSSLSGSSAAKVAYMDLLKDNPCFGLTVSARY